VTEPASNPSGAELVAQDLRASQRYGSITQSVLERTARWAVARTGSRKEAVKLARRRLHQIHGAFIGPHDLKRAQRLLDAVEPPPDQGRLRELCAQVLSCHASTAERLPYLEQFADVVGRFAPRPNAVVDLACGLNPFALPWLDLPADCTYHAVDIDSRVLGLTRRLGELQPVAIETAEWDLVSSSPPAAEGDAVLLLKTLPSLERQDRGAARHVLESLSAPVVFVSFPARSLGGRERGMRETYDAELDRMLPDDMVRVHTESFPTETLYVLARR
jgi:16S rRNA (guanine(1405)-N(7))-methyltransferase